MSSVVYVSPVGHQGEVRFTMPVKSVFGEILCDTDGSIGYATEFGPETALKIITECSGLRLHPLDALRLEKVRTWAASGWTMLARWGH